MSDVKYIFIGIFVGLFVIATIHNERVYNFRIELNKLCGDKINGFVDVDFWRCEKEFDSLPSYDYMFNHPYIPLCSYVQNTTFLKEVKRCK